jgi:hypothetical protein
VSSFESAASPDKAPKTTPVIQQGLTETIEEMAYKMDSLNDEYTYGRTPAYMILPTAVEPETPPPSAYPGPVEFSGTFPVPPACNGILSFEYTAADTEGYGLLCNLNEDKMLKHIARAWTKQPSPASHVRAVTLRKPMTEAMSEPPYIMYVGSTETKKSWLPSLKLPDFLIPADYPFPENATQDTNRCSMM